MPIVGTRYIPEIHTGTREEIIAGLIAEAKDIASNGYMRMHAQGRELARISDELEKLGVFMGDGDDGTEDEGCVVIIIDHAPDCRWRETDRCECPTQDRF